MANKIYTVAILGVGARGGDVYGRLLLDFKDKFKIVALCDKRKERLERFSEIFGVDKKSTFTDENEFFKVKRADMLLIATQDKDHYGHMMKAFDKGYDVMVEKPLTASVKECKDLIEAQKKHGAKALVCHVLRYAPAFVKVGELLREGKIGKLVAIDALERVAFWHQAHSYVRGNWRNTDVAMPMILAKCCHDLDLLQYYADSKAVSVSSVGDNSYFKPECKPDGAANRCTDCAYKDTCKYSAKRIYIDRWEKADKPEDIWPYNVIAPAPVDEKKLYEAIEKGPYGRCVFACDNNVVDHQITTITFENGVKASLTMTAYTYEGGRRYVFLGTEGELILDESENLISVKRYFEEVQNINTETLIADFGGYGHGGGDAVLISTLYDVLSGNADNRTSLERSVESHLMGIAAEESRVLGGELVKIR